MLGTWWNCTLVWVHNNKLVPQFIPSWYANVRWMDHENLRLTEVALNILNVTIAVIHQVSVQMGWWLSIFYFPPGKPITPEAFLLTQRKMKEKFHKTDFVVYWSCIFCKVEQFIVKFLQSVWLHGWHGHLAVNNASIFTEFLWCHNLPCSRLSTLCQVLWTGSI